MAGRTRGTTLALGTFTTISAIIGIASLFISSLNWLIRAAILLMVVALTILGARHWVVIERRFNATGRWISNGRGLMPLVAVVVMASLGLGVIGAISAINSRGRDTAASAADRSDTSRRLRWSFNTGNVVDAGPAEAGATATSAASARCTH